MRLMAVIRVFVIAVEVVVVRHPVEGQRTSERLLDEKVGPWPCSWVPNSRYGRIVELGN